MAIRNKMKRRKIGNGGVGDENNIKGGNEEDLERSNISGTVLYE